MTTPEPLPEDDENPYEKLAACQDKEDRKFHEAVRLHRRERAQRDPD